MNLDFDPEHPVKDWLPTVTYPGFRPGMPDIVLGRLPKSLRDLSGRTWKSFFIENPKEQALLDKAMSEPIPRGPNGELDFIAGPDRAVRKSARGMSISNDLLVAVYSPPADGWPYLVVTSAPFPTPDFERGRYAWEALETEEAAIDHLAKLSEMLPPDAVRGVLKPDHWVQ